MVLCHAYPLARERHVRSTNIGPGTWYNDTINYQAVLVPDLAANKEKLTEFLYE